MIYSSEQNNPTAEDTVGDLKKTASRETAFHLAF
jgi:hypothetical protein